jgi:hypothetical protein
MKHKPTADAAAVRVWGGAPAVPRRVEKAATSTIPVTWRKAMVVLVAVIWFVPVREFSLPVVLPFHLELYRFIILLMLMVFVGSLLSGTLRPTTLNRRKPIVVLIGITLLSMFANYPTLTREGVSGSATKAVFAFFTSVVLFVLIASTVKTFDDAAAIVKMLVIGAGIVGASAIYESQAHYNVFDHLDQWLPILHRDRPPIVLMRNGRLRVRASSQHPIALGVSLMMCAPLALYCARQAATKLRVVLWTLCGVFAVVGAFVTLSRTVTLVLAAMGLAGLWVRRDIIFKLWPLLLLMPALIHFAAPGVLGTIVHSFNPYGGLTTAESQRAGLVGSGRLADINPGLHMFTASPVFGIGIGALDPIGASTAQKLPLGAVSLSAPASGSGGAAASIASNAAEQAAGGGGPPTIIFDDQYMNTLVSLGLVGFVAVVWFIWGVFFALARGARRVKKRAVDDRRPGEMLAALAVASAGFGVGMATLDAFSFIQLTLMFYVIAAVGLRVLAITRRQ